MIDYLQKGQTINWEYHFSNLRQFKEAFKSKRRGKLRVGVLLLKDNAPVHTAQVAVAEAERRGFKRLPHAPYSPDLAPSDFNLFSKLKSHLSGAVLKVTMTSYVLLKGILRLRLQTSSEKGSQSLNIGGQSALKFRGTMVKTNIETIYL